MIALAVDTSTSTITISLKTNTYYEERRIVNGGNNTCSLLVPEINDLCEKQKIKPKDIELYICMKGPGSFTGLRVGMATLKGMAFAGNKPLVSVPTTDVYASYVEDYDGAVVVVLDAKKSRYYLAVYEVKEGKVKRITEDIDGNAEDVKDALKGYKKILVAGPLDDMKKFSPEIEKVLGSDQELEYFYDDIKTLGLALVEAGIKRYEEAGPDDIAAGPVYVRKSDAEIAREERKD